MGGGRRGDLNDQNLKRLWIDSRRIGQEVESDLSWIESQPAGEAK